MGDLDSLRRRLRELERLVVAFSGGADSAFLALVANETLGSSKVLCATAISPSLPESERAACKRFAEEVGLRWTGVMTDELDNDAYVQNDSDRCFHCKTALLDALEPLAHAEGAVVALGVNLDDLGEHRPGQDAARQRGAVFPLVDSGFDKAAIRLASQEAGLSTWNKPAAACLASRVPYGTPVTIGVLGTVERAEAALHALGFGQLRVRHYGDLARLELEPAEFDLAVLRRREIVEAVREAGYRYVTLDLDGFRSGNLNDVLDSAAKLS